jgi:hypothetical protein
MSVERLMEWELAGETEALGENVHQCHFFHHKSHMTWDRTWAAAVRNWRLIAWARPFTCLTLRS